LCIFSQAASAETLPIRFGRASSEQEDAMYRDRDAEASF
jgi:hypothetical protein